MWAPLPFYPWEPDQGPFSGTSIDTVSNLNPLANGWGPYPSLTEVGSSLGAQCYGAWRMRASDGSYTLLAGTQTGLFRYNTATLAWDDISGASAPFSVPTGDLWHGLQFGTKFIVCNIDDPVQVYDVDAGGTFAALAGSPPQAKYIWTAGDFVVLGYLKIGATEYPQRIRWSGLNDATYWTSDRTKGSDFQDMPDGDEITGGIGFPGGARIFQRSAKRTMFFTGGQFVFEFKVLDAVRGCPSPNSIVAISSNDYVFWREDGIFRGDDNIPIGAGKVDRYLFDANTGDLDANEFDTVYGVVDTANKAVLWTYVSNTTSARRVIGWDWELERFFPVDLAVLVMASMVTPGVTMEALATTYPNLDTLTVTLDSRQWKGGSPNLVAFTSTNKLSYFTGAALSGVLETSTTELNPNARAFVTAVKVKGDPGASTTVEVGTAQLPSDVVSYGTAYTRSSRTGEYPARKDGYSHRVRVTTSASDTDWTHIHGVAVDVVPSGEA